MDYSQAPVKWLLLMIVSLSICSTCSAAQQGTDASQSEADGGRGADPSAAAQPQSASTTPGQATQPFVTPNGSKTKVNPKSTNQNQTGRTSKDRLFFTLPNFLTVEDAGRAQPLTAGDKFNLTARSSFDYVQFLWYGAVAGVSQAENQESGYGQGGTGYGKRYGAHVADGTIENFTTEAVLPSLLHQDPRYFQLGKGNFWRRSRYAASRMFITRTDNGKRQFNYSEVLGSAAASAISTYSYYPSSDRNVANVMSLWGTQMAFDTLAFVMREFWPDIRRKIRRSNAGKGP